MPVDMSPEAIDLRLRLTGKLSDLQRLIDRMNKFDRDHVYSFEFKQERRNDTTQKDESTNQ